MAKKPSVQFKRFSNAMSKIVRVTKDELAKREHADKQRRAQKKAAVITRTAPVSSKDTLPEL